jgi:hypothetical protein
LGRYQQTDPDFISVFREQDKSSIRRRNLKVKQFYGISDKENKKVKFYSDTFYYFL